MDLYPIGKQPVSVRQLRSVRRQEFRDQRRGAHHLPRLQKLYRQMPTPFAAARRHPPAENALSAHAAVSLLPSSRRETPTAEGLVYTALAQTCPEFEHAFIP